MRFGSLRAFTSHLLERRKPMSEFTQPVIENNTDPLPGGVSLVQPVAVPMVDNSGKTDELSRAVADASRVVVQEAAPVNRDPAKFKLDYVYNGEMIHESHTTVRGALARIASLKRLGIVPATSTSE